MKPLYDYAIKPFPQKRWGWADSVISLCWFVFWGSLGVLLWQAVAWLQERFK